MRPREDERGMILVNVLLIVALASGIVALMLSAQDGGVQRAIRLREAARADAAIAGGELSAITALRRDGASGAAGDTSSEPWARIGDRDVAIAGGRFGLEIADAQAKFNLNALARHDLVAEDLMARIAATLGLPADAAPRIATLVRALGHLASLDQLALAGIDPGTIAKLAPLVTVLPAATEVNVNTADERLLAVLLGNPVSARLLASRRARGGGLTNDDFALAHALLPPGAGFTSDFFWVRTRVTIGDTAREQASLLLRRRDQRGVVVEPIGRWNGAAIPLEAPPPLG